MFSFSSNGFYKIYELAARKSTEKANKKLSVSISKEDLNEIHQNFNLSSKPYYNLHYKEFAGLKVEEQVNNYLNNKFKREYSFFYENPVIELVESRLSPYLPTPKIILKDSILKDLEQEYQKFNNSKDFIDLSSKQIFELFLKNFDGVISDWSTDFMNLWNKWYYTAENAYDKELELANYFTHYKHPNVILSNIIKQHTQNKNSIRIKELAASGLGCRYDVFATDLKEKKLYLTVSNLSKPIICNDPTTLDDTDFILVTDEENILNETPKVRQKYDVIYTTYGFDSISFPGDVVYFRSVDDKWFKMCGRFKKSDLAKDGVKTDNFSIEELEFVFPECVFIPVDIAKEPFGDQIASYFQGCDSEGFGYISAPIGMINKITEYFDTQITKDGYMIIGDIYNADRSISKNIPYNCSGKAMFRLDHIYFVEQILKLKGFNVEISTVNKSSKYCPDDLEIDSNTIAPNHYYMILSKVN